MVFSFGGGRNCTKGALHGAAAQRPLISHCIFQDKEAQNENVKDGRHLALSTADSQTLP